MCYNNETAWGFDKRKSCCQNPMLLFSRYTSRGFAKKACWRKREGEEAMYQIGELVIYSSEGVCQVQDVGLPDIPAADPQRTYYTLSPLYREGLIYIPVDSPVFMRPVISKKEAERLVSIIPDMAEASCDEKNMRFLVERYDTLLRSHSCEDLLQLIKILHKKKVRAVDMGKKPGAVDERYMKRAEELLYGELATVLEMPKDAVLEFVRCAVAKVKDAV